MQGVLPLFNNGRSSKVSALKDFRKSESVLETGGWEWLVHLGIQAWGREPPAQQESADWCMQGCADLARQIALMNTMQRREGCR